MTKRTTIRTRTKRRRGYTGITGSIRRAYQDPQMSAGVGLNGPALGAPPTMAIKRVVTQYVPYDIPAGTAIDENDPAKRGFIGNNGFMGAYALKWNLGNFFSTSNIPLYDQYRITKLKVFAHHGDYIPSTVQWICSSVDYDDHIVSNYQSMTLRSGLKLSVLKPIAPIVELAEFTPRAEFSPSSTQNPGNLVPAAGAWLDTRAFNQPYVGLKINISSKEENKPVKAFAVATIEFRYPVS